MEIILFNDIHSAMCAHRCLHTFQALEPSALLLTRNGFSSGNKVSLAYMVHSCISLHISLTIGYADMLSNIIDPTSIQIYVNCSFDKI